MQRTDPDCWAEIQFVAAKQKGTFRFPIHTFFIAKILYFRTLIITIHVRSHQIN
jgi:hypothetical protein